MNRKLSAGIKLLYSLAEMGVSMLRSVGDFFLLFYYTDVAGIDPALVGTALLLGKLTWDAINDPLFGYWSDRTRSRFGRRRIYMLIGALPVALACWIQLSLPYGLTGIAAFFAVLFTFWLKDTFLTVFVVPYWAMAPELTHDYRERSSLATYRGVCNITGYILGAAGTTMLAGFFRGNGLNLQQAWSATGLTYGVVAMMLFLITTFAVKEPAELAGKPSALPAFKSVIMCFKNRPFVILVAVFILTWFGNVVQSALFPYLLQYRLNMNAQIPTVLIILLLTTAVCIIPIKLLADKINKGPAYAVGLSVAALTLIWSYFFLPTSPTPLIYVMAVLLGMGLSAQWVFPFAMMPDVIEHDEKMTGERREGVHQGISNFITKLAVALGTAVPAWALAWFGYVPNVVQADGTQWGILFVFSVVPAVSYLACLPFLLRYPITRKSHAALLEEIDEKKNVDRRSKSLK